MKKAPRMKDIQNLIASYTANGITAHTYDFSSCNAHDIALILKIDRTNVSRVLNQLHRENRLIKLQGRPTCISTPVSFTHFLQSRFRIHCRWEEIFRNTCIRISLCACGSTAAGKRSPTPVFMRTNLCIPCIRSCWRFSCIPKPSKLGALCPLWRRQASFLKFFYRKGEGAAAAWQAYTNTGACAKRCGR